MGANGELVLPQQFQVSNKLIQQAMEHARFYLSLYKLKKLNESTK